MIPVYEKTFNNDFIAIWQNTPFANEIPLLSLYRSITCWIHDGDLGIEDRRRLIRNYLTAWFPTQKETDILNRADSNLSTDNALIYRILNNINTLYKVSPTRAFEGFSDKDNEYISDIIEQDFLNLRLQEAFNLAWLTGEMLIRPKQYNRRWRFEVLPRDLYRIRYDNYGNLLEIWVPFQIKEKQKIETKFHIWTPEVYYQADINGKPIQFEYLGTKVTEVKHQYKDKTGTSVVPYVKLALADDEIYGGGKWELIRDVLNLSLIDYLIQENLVFGTTGFWFAKNLVDYTKNQFLPLTPSKLIHVTTGSIDEPEPEIEHKSANFIASELLGLKREYENIIMRKYGIPVGMISDNPNLPSGVAMLIDRIEIEETQERLKPIAKHFENQFFNTLIAVNNAELPYKLPYTKVSVDFKEFTPFYEFDKEIEISDMLLERGLISPLEYVRRLTKNETITNNEQAIEYIVNNLRYKNEFRSRQSNFGSDANTGDKASGAVSIRTDDQ